MIKTGIAIKFLAHRFLNFVCGVGAIILLFIGITYAATWSPGGPPQAAPGEGNVGISGGTSLWSANGSDIYYNGDNVGIGTATPGEKLEVSGNVKAVSFFYSSDISLKKDIQLVPDALEKILQLDGILFKWKENGKKDLGLIAQNVESVFPELVSTNKTTGLKSVQYGNLVAPLIEAIKQQQKQIGMLQAELLELK